MEVMRGPERFDPFGPFNKAICARVEVFFQTDVHGFGVVFKAVAIEVVNRFTGLGRVLVDQPVGWTLHHTHHVQNPAKSLD